MEFQLKFDTKQEVLIFSEENEDSYIYIEIFLYK